MIKNFTLIYTLNNTENQDDLFLLSDEKWIDEMLNSLEIEPSFQVVESIRNYAEK